MKYKLAKPFLNTESIKEYHAVLIKIDHYWFENEDGRVLVKEFGGPLCNADIKVSEHMLEVFSKASGFELKIKLHKIAFIPVSINDWDYIPEV